MKKRTWELPWDVLGRSLGTDSLRQRHLCFATWLLFTLLLMIVSSHRLLDSGFRWVSLRNQDWSLCSKLKPIRSSHPLAAVINPEIDMGPSLNQWETMRPALPVYFLTPEEIYSWELRQPFNNKQAGSCFQMKSIQKKQSWERWGERD